MSDEDMFVQGNPIKFKHLQPRWWHKLMFWRKEPKYGMLRNKNVMWFKLDDVKIGEGIKVNLGKAQKGYSPLEEQDNE